MKFGRDSYAGLELGIWSLTDEAVYRLKLDEENVFNGESKVIAKEVENVGEIPIAESKVEILPSTKERVEPKSAIIEIQNEDSFDEEDDKKIEVKQEHNDSYDWRKDDKEPLRETKLAEIKEEKVISSVNSDIDNAIELKDVEEEKESQLKQKGSGVTEFLDNKESEFRRRKDSEKASSIRRDISPDVRDAFQKQIVDKVTSFNISKEAGDMPKEYVKEVDNKIKTIVMKDGKLLLKNRTIKEPI